MTRLHWILLAIVLVTWLPSYIWYFHGDAMRWWQGRGAARRERAERAAAQTKLNDELAAKYMNQAADPGPRA